MTMCLIVNGYQDRAVWISRTNSVSFWFMGSDEEQSLQTNGGYTRWMACFNLGSAARIQKHEDQLRQTTHSLRTQAAKCLEVDGHVHTNCLSVCLSVHSNRSISVASHNWTCPYKLSVCLSVHSNRCISVASHNWTCPYKLSVSHWLILPPLKTLTFPPESPCTD